MCLIRRIKVLEGSLSPCFAHTSRFQAQQHVQVFLPKSIHSSSCAKQRWCFSSSTRLLSPSRRCVPRCHCCDEGHSVDEVFFSSRTSDSKLLVVGLHESVDIKSDKMPRFSVVHPDMPHHTFPRKMDFHSFPRLQPAESAIWAQW